MKAPRTAARAWMAALIFGVLSTGLCFVILRAHNQVKPEVGAADFRWALRSARELLAGQDPYAHPPGPYAIPYPLPAALAALPVAPLPDVWAASVFFGVSTTLFVFGFIRAGEDWRLLSLLSWNYIYAMIWVQWTPLLSAIWYLSPALLFVLCKPNIGLPIVLAGKIERRPVYIAAAFLAASLLWDPMWPVKWVQQTSTYQGIKPPLFVLPWGPLALVSLLCWKDRRAWLIALLALMPQRMVYDQLPLLLVAANPFQLAIMVAGSWISFAVLWNSDGFSGVPGGWQNLILATSYLPAVAVLFWSNRAHLFKRRPVEHENPGQPLVSDAGVR